ncbi:PROTEIN PLASTID REDOX INSENSITIVE 2 CHLOROPLASTIC [Salix koriyanagi]|uniref:PROTEIN PLASTID REDOX INSENSITIVE 2 CHLOROPLASTIC n=1 Tax=Salix koriyanagi TaxID=2511006 RepID=A0A9Q0WRX9_9ROSI|nr:PROTEIN PLASTID REDOX INSENSITIVE 2 CHLOROPLASTIC [Salix koriyanagi]
MASFSKAIFSSELDICSPCSYRSSLSFPPNFSFSSTTFFAFGQLKALSLRYSSDFQPSSSIINKAQTQPRRHICRAAEYKFPDPIPEFAVAETEKFKSHLFKKLTKKDIYGDSLQDVVGICTEVVYLISLLISPSRYSWRE